MLDYLPECYLNRKLCLTDDEFVTFLCRICVAATARVPSGVMQFIVGVRHVGAINHLTIDPKIMCVILGNAPQE